MKEKLGRVPYEEAKLEITLIDELDVIVTSPTMGWEDNMDDSGWT